MKVKLDLLTLLSNYSIAVRREFFIAPSYEEFKASMMWSLENAFTTTFKKLNPVSQIRDDRKIG
jgi:hypothetical protein